MRLKYCIGPYMVWASSFKHLDYKWNWMYKRNTQIYMYMIFFHTNSNGCDVEFFADSFYDSLYWFLNWFRKTFSSIFRNPYYVIPAVIDSMWCFSVHHVDLYWVMYTLDTLVTIGLKANFCPAQWKHKCHKHCQWLKSYSHAQPNLPVCAGQHLY